MPTGNGQPRTYDTTNPGDYTVGNLLVTTQLLAELRADAGLVGNQVDRVDTAGTDILLWFPSVLSGPEQTAADAVVLAHNGVPAVPPAEMESDGTEVNGDMWVYSASEGAFINVTMVGDASIDETGDVTVTGFVADTGDTMTGDLNMASNTAIKIRNPGDTFDLIFDFSAGGSPTITRSDVGGAMFLFPDAAFPQWIFGSNAAATVALYIDCDNDGEMRLNTLHQGAVIAGPGGFAVLEPAGGQQINIKAPTIAADWTLTLPVDDGTPGQLLETDGAGVTSWVDPGAGGIGGSITDNQVAIGAATADEIEGSGALEFDPATAHLTVGDGVITTPEINLDSSAAGDSYLNFLQNGVLRSRLWFDDTNETLRLEQAGLDNILFATNGTTRFSITATGVVSTGDIEANGDVIVPAAAGQIFLDGGVDTYIREVSSNRIELVGQGNTMAVFDQTFVDLGNYTFNVNQTVGAGQDEYVLQYNNATGEIELTEKFEQFVMFEDLAQQSTTSGTFVTAATFTTASLPAGEYFVSYQANVGTNSNKKGAFELDWVTGGFNLAQRSGKVEGGDEFGGMFWAMMSGSATLTMSGVNTFEFNFAADDESYYRQIRLTLWRISP